MKVNMHSHERTLLAGLGFADPDKRDRRHDLACQYLSQPENALAIVKMFSPRVLGIRKTEKQLNNYNQYEEEGHNGEEQNERGYEVESPTVKTEVHVGKGDGKYRTTIGFIDLCYSGWLMKSEINRTRDRKMITKYDRATGVSQKIQWDAWSEWRSDGGRYDDGSMVLLEVKITPVGVGDVIRQLNLYREFVSPGTHGARGGKIHWVVVTHYPMTTADVDQLKASDITHIRLSEKFNQFIEDQKQSAQECESVKI